jgi:cell wall assembly regulator SMI1
MNSISRIAERNGLSPHVLRAALQEVGLSMSAMDCPLASHTARRVASIIGGQALGRKADDYLLYSLYFRDVQLEEQDFLTAENAVAAEKAAQAALIRDIFGNPFRPAAIDAAWRTPTAVALAGQMYESRDFGAMPILADALQDAGCDNEEVLDHCRGPGPHVRGCWVVDLVLGKEYAVGKVSPIGRITYRDNPAATTYSVESAWERLKRWSVANLPQDDAEDRPPASEKQLREVEKAIGAELPKDVRDSYRVYDGQCGGPGVVYGLTVEPLGDCLGHWRGWEEGYGENLKDGSAADLDSSCSSFPDGYVRPVYFDRGWFPLTYDSGGNHIGVDLNPGPEGTRGQVIVFGRDDEFHTVLALSWGQLLTDLADELEAGNFRPHPPGSGRPWFDIDDPHRKHFHSVGIYWSRAKLGLRRLSAANAKLWKKWGAK